MIGNIVCGQKNNENNIDIKGDIIEARVGSEQINKGDFVTLIKDNSINYNEFNIELNTSKIEMINLADDKIFLIYLDNSDNIYKVILGKLNKDTQTLDILYNYD